MAELFMNLIGKKNKERDRILLEAHKQILKNIEMYKQGKIKWEDIDIIQNSLMNATGYMKKEVNYNQFEYGAIVEFTQNIVPSGPLIGRGKNELEAICDACENLLKDPQKYNTFSKKYIDILKNQPQ